jgi:hypothetical protein
MSASAAGRIGRLPGDLEHPLVDVGGEDLDRRGLAEAVGGVGEQHGDAVGLLAAGAARNPDPDVLVRIAAAQQRLDRPLPEELEQLGVAEEAGDVDQEVAEQRLALGLVGADAGEIGPARIEAEDVHAPLDPAHQGGPLVAGEVVAHRRAEHPAKVVDVVGDRARLRGVGAAAAEERREAIHDLARRLHEIDEAGPDGGERHAVVARRVRLLHHADAAMLLHGAQAGGPVGPRARQDHASGVGLLVDGERQEEIVDRPPQPPRLHEMREFEDAVLDDQAPARRDDVDPVAGEPLAALALVHRQLGVPVEELGQHALVVGIEMLDDDEGHPGRGPGPGQHLAQGFEPARRGADPHHRPGEGRGYDLPGAVQDLRGFRPGRVKEILVHRDPRG